MKLKILFVNSIVMFIITQILLETRHEFLVADIFLLAGFGISCGAIMWFGMLIFKKPDKKKGGKKKWVK